MSHASDWPFWSSIKWWKSWLFHNVIESVASSLLDKFKVSRKASEGRRTAGVWMCYLLYFRKRTKMRECETFNSREHLWHVLCSGWGLFVTCWSVGLSMSLAVRASAAGQAGGASWSSVWTARRFAAGFEMIALFKIFVFLVVSTRRLHANYLLINCV